MPSNALSTATFQPTVVSMLGSPRSVEVPHPYQTTEGAPAQLSPQASKTSAKSSSSPAKAPHASVTGSASSRTPNVLTALMVGAAVVMT